MYRGPDRKARTAGTFPTKTEAKDAAVLAEAEALKPRWRDPKGEKLTWGEWCTAWWPSRSVEQTTLDTEESMVRIHIEPVFKDVPLIDITRHSVQDWATQLSQVLAAGSAQRVLGVLVSSLSGAIDAGHIDHNPATRIKLPPRSRGREVFLTREQYASILENVPHPDDRALLDFLVGTGARWGEAAGLHWHNVDLMRGTVTIVDTYNGVEIKPYPKGRRERRVPLFDWIVRDLDDERTVSACEVTHRIGRCTSGLVFPGRRGGVRDDRNFSRQVWTPALKAAGLDGLGATLHDLRHTYASWLVQAGVPLERIASLLGHASIATTQIYAHLAPASHDDVRLALGEPRLADGKQTAIASGYVGLRATK
nr:tyrosine-type recombinase/integrase [Mycetocola tolaasinivorans]